MSREIKFRAYSKSRNRYLGKGDTLIYRHEVELDGSRWWASLVERQDHADEDIIVEQYTGIKDKNGKEIYEGDILEIWIGGVKQIPPYIVTDLRELYLDFNRDDSYYCLSACRIIGNIHENPELLEEKKCNQ